MICRHRWSVSSRAEGPQYSVSADKIPQCFIAVTRFEDAWQKQDRHLARLIVFRPMPVQLRLTRQINVRRTALPTSPFLSPCARKARRRCNPCPRSARLERDEPRVVSRFGFELAAISESLTPPAPVTQRRPFFGDLERSLACEDSRARAASAVASKRELAFSLSRFSAKPRGATRQAARTLRVRDQFAESQQNMLKAGEAGRRGLSPSPRRVRAWKAPPYPRRRQDDGYVQSFHLPRLLVIVLPAGLQVQLPAVTADGHLHDL